MSANLETIREQQRKTWDRFSHGWKKWDELVLDWMAPVSEAMIRHANLADDSRVLDVAAGTGEPGLTAAAQVPHGSVTATDLSERMLAVAEQSARERGLDNYETEVCEAGDIPFEDARFDAILCRFGFMFFPDIDAGLREFTRVAKPGARICAAVWSEPEKNPWAMKIMGIIAQHVELPPSPPGSPGLFRCAPAGMMRTAFAQAGLRDIDESEVLLTMVHKGPEQYWDFMTDVAAPVVAGLAQADMTTQKKIRDEVVDFARQSMNGGKAEFSGAARVIVGTR